MMVARPLNYALILKMSFVTGHRSHLHRATEEDNNCNFFSLTSLMLAYALFSKIELVYIHLPLEFIPTFPHVSNVKREYVSMDLTSI